MTILILSGLLGVQFFLLTNLQFTAWPEMLSYSYLHNNGFLLYRDMIHPYPPLLAMFLSVVYKFFGYDLWIIKAIAWTIILFSSFLLYYVINYVTNSRAIALVGLAFYVLVQPFLEGNMLWFDMALIPSVLLGTYFALRFVREKEDKFIFLASLSFSVAALTKQTAALFLIALGLYVLVRIPTWKRLLKVAIAPIILLIPLIVRLLQEGAVQDFINWIILYPLGEWGKFPGYVQMSLSGRELPVILILLTPNIVLYIVRRKVFSDYSSFLLPVFLVLSVILVYPRFSFFHFQLALVFIVLNLTVLIKTWDIKKVGLLFGIILLGIIPFVHKPVLATNWQEEARFFGRQDMILAEKIVDLTDPGDKLFLLGLHSGLYVMADRLPPKRWTDNFGWYLEIPGVQEEILSRWVENTPSIVIWRQPGEGNWFDLGVYQPQKIVEYVKNNYNFTGEVEPGVQIWSVQHAQDKQK